ncbi:MAG: ATP-binding cassette domain-containing protein [Gemmatimonadetes bacterium]|nr:ATP-binding cassette domain-containing protein [Gemmatimonadota bacterium]
MSTLSTRALRIRYPAQSHWALDGVTLDVAPGAVTWLTGALGSGTSTLLLAMAGLAPRLTGGERRGEVLLDGRDVATLAPLPHGIAYLGPTPALQLSGIAATVRDEIAVGPMNLGWPVEQIRAAADDAMQRLGIGHLADRAPRALSGGEQQRVLLAALAATSPTLWLLDEPFSALDATSRAHVQRWLRGLTRGGATVVIACDEADTIVEIADRLVVLQHGTVALDGAPAPLLAGDAILATGAATTEAAALAAAAQMPAPRPILAAPLLGAVGLAARTGVVEMIAAPLAAGTPLLECRDVQFAYRDGPAVLRGVSVSVHAGEAVGVFGANGAGKSTLLRLAMALDHPTSGTVTVRGLETRGRHPEELAPAVGFLFQQPERQLFSASVRAECAVGPRLAGWSSARVHEAVAAVLAELGLDDVIDEHPYDLPVPRRRLVALAAVLATDPELLLLDEPTAALDGASRSRVAGVVRARVARGRAVVAITHDASFAHEALDRALWLRDGQIVRDGATRSILTAGGHDLPATLVAALALDLPPGADRQLAVAAALSRRQTR